MAQINFDINNVLDDLENDGVFSASEAARIRKKNSNLSSSSNNDKIAAGVNLLGSQITASDPNGTNTGAQSIGNAAQGAASGFAIGGPWGAAVGGVIGGAQGALGASQARKNQNRQAEAERITSIANIQSRATQDRNAGVNDIISNLSRTLVSGR